MSGYMPPTPIIKPFCNSGAEVDPPSGTSATVANQEIGYPPSQATPLNAGGIPVDIEQTNGIHKFYSEQILSIIAGTRFTFNQFFVDQGGVGTNGYPIGAMLYCASNNSYQVSLVNNNTANFITTPSFIDDGINWLSSQSFFDVDVQKLLSIKTGGQTRYYNTGNTFYTGFTADSASVNCIYTLPPTPPLFNSMKLAGAGAGGFGDLYWDDIEIAFINQSTSVTKSQGSSLTFNTVNYYKTSGTSTLPWNTTTGVFTAPATGRYRIAGIIAGLISNSSSSGEFGLIYASVNGSSAVSSQVLFGSALNVNVAGTFESSTYVNINSYVNLIINDTLSFVLAPAISGTNNITYGVSNQFSRQLEISWNF